ncbi:hypothetical protein PENTCL1PPCAC_29721 [Pristionchus entomophagus]|uniref:protein O-GlcNAcase n=1 Tax=Pristionchus entomophagus TaxID=358040 RepID=A0AAV5ULS7_9BILA|nr:hypothetical protein PENTCL1PPCAC_29721 [Pristionchus entomophagus]
MITTLDICSMDAAAMEGHPLLRPPSKPFIRGIIEGFYGAPWTQSQRRDLLRTLAQQGLNTYVYAPKDDVKHRKEWREKYGTEEAAELQSLIEYAKSLNINFVYALSPGIDIEYSRVKDISAVKAKLEQLKSIGCESFALLFDDIEYQLSDADESQFGTPANAQVAVVNDCYTQLNSPAHFYFCPTEYCSTRAKPTLLESDYLRTIGDRLHPGVEIFWTGALVVPESISEDNCRAVSMVLKRKPLIWDNIYANDYDTKRMFLGPFKGRGQSLKKECCGLLLNPNCQFDLNRPAILSYTEWFNAEEEGSDTDDSSMTTDPPSSRFVPGHSFERAMTKWMKELFLPFIPTRIRLAEVEFGSSGSSQLTTFSQATDSPNEGSSEMIMEEPKPNEEPMDRSPSCGSDISMADSGRFTTIIESSPLTIAQLCALADCYYLPFEHGQTANDILNGILWMYRHANVMAPGYIEEVRKRSVSGNSNGSDKNFEEIEKTRANWILQHQKITECIELISGAFRALCANKIHNPDLVQYASDAYGVLIVVEAVLGWIREGHLSELTEPRERRWTKPEYFGEPWHLSFSFVENIGYSMLPPSHLHSVLFGHRDVDPMTAILSIRGLRREDTPLLSPLRRTVADDDVDSIFSLETFVDKYYRPFLDWSEKHCFLAEEETKTGKIPVASVCGVLNIIEYHEHHNKLEADRMSGEGELPSPPAWMPAIPTEPAIGQFSSFFDLRVKDESDIPAAKRLIQTLAVVMAYNGAVGIYTCCLPSERDKVSLLLSLNFVELSSTHTDQILLGLRLVMPDVVVSEDEEESEQKEEDSEREIKEKSVDERGDKDDY